MFLFGLFASHIPYIVLSILYVLYICTWGISSFLFHFSDESANINYNDPKKIEVIVKNDLPSKNVNKLYAKSYFYKFSKINKSPNSFVDFLSINSSCITQQFITYQRLSYDIILLVFSGFSTEIFSRPPPTLS